MSFGLMDALSMLQKMMDDVLQRFPFAKVYVDNVIIFSKSTEDHVRHFEQFFGRIQKQNLKIKVKKCSFGHLEINLLRHVVNKKGIKVDTGKAKDIVEAPPPKNVTELRRLLGIAGYYRRFIKNFAYAAVLHAATSVKKDLDWAEGMKNAFEDLENKPMKPPVLANPDFETSFRVETDTSSTALVLALAQKKEGGMVNLVQYTSRMMKE